MNYQQRGMAYHQHKTSMPVGSIQLSKHGNL